MNLNSLWPFKKTADKKKQETKGFKTGEIRHYSGAPRQDDSLDMMNPANPLSPLSPLSPFWIGNTHENTPPNHSTDSFQSHHVDHSPSPSFDHHGSSFDHSSSSYDSCSTPDMGHHHTP